MSIYLFADNNEGTAENLGSYRLYNMKIDGDDPRDFQPVLDSNGVPCLMDKINKKYYYDKNGNGFKYNGYTPVGYLQGDGNGYIDTGIYANPQYSYEVTMSLNPDNGYDLYNWGKVFGNGAGNVLGQKGSSVTNGFYFYLQGNEIGSLPYNNKKTTYTMKNGIITNGTDVVTYEVPTSTTPFTETILLFRANTPPHCWERIHSFKMWNENNELVFDGIPVLDNEGTPCLYDLVTETFFYNQGTGEFSYGIEELDGATDTYTPIKYIETNGTQYIDTGVVPTDNTDIDMVASAVGETPLYLMNELIIDTTYKYNEIDTTVEPNLTASDGATLTLGSTYMAYLTEDEIEQAVDNGWTIQ